MLLVNNLVNYATLSLSISLSLSLSYFFFPPSHYFSVSEGIHGIMVIIIETGYDDQVFSFQ